MARRKINNQSSLPKTLLLGLVWLLIKIGQLEFLVFRLLLKFLVFIVGLPLGLIFLLFKGIFRLTHLVHLPQPPKKVIRNSAPIVFNQAPSPSILQVLKLKSRKRGRPRTTPFFQFYGRKLKRLLDKIFPKPLRIAVTLAILAGLFFGYSISLIKLAHELPNPNRLKESDSPLTTEFYDRNGKLLYRLYDGRNRSIVKISDLPPYVINATVAIEDKNFWSHPGVDLYGIIRALLSNLQHRQVQGGSTLTQQLVKNILLTPDRTWQRKAQEVLLSFWAERVFSKKEILQMYFNEIGYGGIAYGIDAAAKTYFGKSAKDLNLAEAAYLAGLPASPTTYSPYGANPNLAKERQQEVLRRMVEDGYISQAQADGALAEQLNIRPPQASLNAPHFVMYVRQYLEEKYGSRLISQGGLKVVTSLDLETQHMAETAVSEEVAKIANLNVTNGAAMVMDPQTGQILAMVGSVDYNRPDDGNFNVTLALRQPGSSIKPITYATAFKQGYTPGTVLLDAPADFYDGIQHYTPVNYDGKFHGPVTIRTALGSSFNVPAVKTLQMVGIPNMLQTARDLGITTLNDTSHYGLSLTLGAGEVRLVDMMTVYSTFSQMGVKHYPTPVLKITDSSGDVLEDNSHTDGVQVLNPGIAYMITDILKDNKARTPAFGPSSLLAIKDHEVSVKTGTTDNKKDNWTFGYTPGVVVGVWVGNNNGEVMDPRLTSGITGAAPIWARIMTTLLKDQPNLAFIKPEDVGLGTVDGNHDLVLNGVDTKSAVAKKQEKKKDGDKEKDVITFTDPFSTLSLDAEKQANP